jgi:hypothetical protein
LSYNRKERRKKNLAWDRKKRRKQKGRRKDGGEL